MQMKSLADITNPAIKKKIGEGGSLDSIANTQLFLTNFITLSLIIAGVLSFFMLLWGGIGYITAGGDKEATQNAKLMDPAVNELVVVKPSGTNPLTITVAVCWRHRNRIVGECTWNGAALDAIPGAGGNLQVTESPAMLTTFMTCRR